MHIIPWERFRWLPRYSRVRRVARVRENVRSTGQCPTCGRPFRVRESVTRRAT